MASTGPDIAQRERLKNSANYNPIPPAATFVLNQVRVLSSYSAVPVLDGSNNMNSHKTSTVHKLSQHVFMNVTVTPFPPLLHAVAFQKKNQCEFFG
jgi:hypothetical protein